MTAMKRAEVGNTNAHKLKRRKYENDRSKVADMMMKATDSKHAPWHILRSDDKRRARLNCIEHILSLIPHKTIRR
jgi:polyphosphate kinase 2 (PPK2 family)